MICYQPGKLFGWFVVWMIGRTVLAHKSEPSATFESPHHPAAVARHNITLPIYIGILKEIEYITRYALVLGVPSFCFNTGFNPMTHCCTQIVKDLLVNSIPCCYDTTQGTMVEGYRVTMPSGGFDRI